MNLNLSHLFVNTLGKEKKTGTELTICILNKMNYQLVKNQFSSICMTSQQTKFSYQTFLPYPRYIINFKIYLGVQLLNNTDHSTSYADYFPVTLQSVLRSWALLRDCCMVRELTWNSIMICKSKGIYLALGFSYFLDS